MHRAERGDANDTRAIVQRLAALRAERARAARLSRTRRLHARRPDGEDARGGDQAADRHREAGRVAQGARRSAAHAGDDRQRRRRLHARAVGLAVLRRAACARPSTTSTRRRSSRTSSWNACCTTACSSPRSSSSASRSSSAPTFRSISRTCASSRCSTRTARRSRCSTPTTSSATTRRGGAWMDSFVDQSRLLGRKPVDLQRRELHEAGARAAGAAQLRRSDHAVPRVRPRAARHALEGRSIRRSPARTCRATSSSSRRSSTSTGRSSPTVFARYAQAPRDRRADAAGAGREDQEVAHVQSGLCAHRIHRRGAARHGVAHAAAGRAAAGRRRVRAGRAQALRGRRARGAAAIPHARTSRTSGTAATRPDTTRICGPRCSTTTHTRGSRSTAG